VAEAVREAALVIRRATHAAPVPTGGAAPRARWDWPAADDALAGDWYPIAPVPASPLAARLGAVEWDSVPPAVATVPLPPAADAWVALSARLARRGAERPLLVGRDSGGTRTLTTAGQGLWRWALRGGAPREAYRALVAAGVDWLLGTARAGGAARLTATEVGPRGIPVTFRWRDGPAPGAPVALTLASDDTTRSVDLAFDARGEARLSLDPGVYRWRAAGLGAGGLVVVEEYSDEFVPRPPAVPGGREWRATRQRVGARETWWIFGIALGALCLEWAWRVRRGLP
jgi:hypothetical protein